jgi:methionyl-tRNA synthetase
MTNPIYITTTIPYVNAPPHVGFALELVQADALARYHRLLGRAVRFHTGTDENAFKNVSSARALGVPVREFVDTNVARFRTLGDGLSISYDRFVRTTDPSHHAAVHELLGRLRKDDVYQSGYRGLYCSGCEDFYLERDLIDGRVCPDHLVPAVEISERNHFFRLSAYAEQLHNLISSRRLRIVPEARETEVLQFIARGLTDISLSRDATRSDGWGVPFPNDRAQIVYVWIDALVNYLSGLGFPSGDDFNRFWSGGGGRIHAIGKNVWKFHAIYWPALLLSAGLELPTEIFVHGFLTNEGRKLSKSAGGATDPTEYVSTFGADSVRYFLLRHVRPFEDTDFSERRLREAHNADLANGLGNLTSRLTTLCESAALESPADPVIDSAPSEYHDAFAEYRFDAALEVLWAEVRELNRVIGEERAWDDIAGGRRDVARRKLAPLAHRLRVLAHWLSPFVPATSSEIVGAFGGTTVTRTRRLFERLP